ncbi:MAG: class I SAM-dependent methyltransferase [Bacteroidota bacterium]
MNISSTDNFDDFAADYRHLHNKNMKFLGGDSYYFAQAKVRHVRDHESETALNILDIGCGDGLTAFCMAALLHGCKITGIDISAESIDIANTKKIPGAVFRTYNGIDFPFAENSFDLLFIAGVLHHVSPVVQARIIEEAHRVLKNGGRIYVFEHNPYNPATRYLVKTCPFDKYAKLIKSGSVISLMKSGQFKNIQSRYTTFFPQNNFFSAFHNVEKKLSWCPFGAQFYVRAIK